MSAAVPAWFSRALDAPVETRSVAADGLQISYRLWGPPSAQGVVLVHGGGAHSRWWDHIAPLLLGGRRVAALDLSGHGDSERRPQYSLQSWAHEVMGVAADAGMTDPPVVVGHSMGGFVALQAALEHGEHLQGAIIVDSPVHDLSPEEHAAFERRAFGPLRRYRSCTDAVAKFRTIPEQDDNLPYVLAHVAATSVIERDDAWTWKFDPLIFRDPFLRPAKLGPLACKLALLRAERGRLTADMTADVQRRIGHTAVDVEIPAAGHHVMLDQPLALVAVIRTVLSSWS